MVWLTSTAAAVKLQGLMCWRLPVITFLQAVFLALDLSIAVTSTRALGWAEPQYGPSIFSVWFRTLKCACVKIRVPQRFLLFASFLLLSPYVAHTKYILIQNFRVEKNHLHSNHFFIPSQVFYGYGTSLYSSSFWTLLSCTKGGWGVEWSHCYPCAPYHTVLNSRTWVINKLFQSFKQPIANCRVSEQESVAMDTYVYLCATKISFPVFSNRDGTVFEWVAKKDYWWYWLNVPQSLQSYGKFPVLGQKASANSSGAPAVFKLLSFPFQWQPLSFASL